MFIYSNHYLILSKLTQENFDDYYTNFFNLKPIYLSYIKNDIDVFTGIENLTLNIFDYHDYVDLSVYEFESSDYAVFEKDNFLVESGDTEHVWFERDENVIDSELDYSLIFDQHHSSMASEPFLSVTWSSSFTYYKINLPEPEFEKDESEESKELKRKQKVINEHRRIAKETFLVVPYKNEDLIKPFVFPTETKINYYLSMDNKFTYIPDSDEHLHQFEDLEEFKKTYDFEKPFDFFHPDNFREPDNFDEDLNHIINQEYSLELDAIDSEYWHEPTFAFSLVREIYIFKTKNYFFRKKKKFFFYEKNKFNSPINATWYRTLESDYSTSRYEL